MPEAPVTPAETGSPAALVTPAEASSLEVPVTPAEAAAWRRRRWLVLVVILLVVAALDQLSKHWAQEHLQQVPGGRITVVEGYLAFAYVRNPGAAWGFLSRSKESFRQPFFICISLLAMGFILFIHHRLEPGQLLLLVALSLVMGGAVGNFIDRLRYRYVVDFIKMHLQQRFEWPTYNVADVAITIGVVLLFIEMFFGPWLQRRRLRAALAAAAGEARGLVGGGEGDRAEPGTVAGASAETGEDGERR